MKIDIEKIRQNYCNRDEDLYDYQRDNKEKIYEAWMNNQSVMPKGSSLLDKDS